MVLALNRKNWHHLRQYDLFGLGFDSERYHNTSSQRLKKACLNIK